MLKYATLLAPYLLKAPHRNPAKRLAGFTLAYGLLAIGTLFVFISGFIWGVSHYSYEASFAVGGLFLIIASGFILLFLKRPKKSRTTPYSNQTHNDPLETLLPESVKQDPIVQSVLKQVSENPLVSTLVAIFIGVFLARELFEEN